MRFRLFLFGALALGSIQPGGRLYAQTGAAFRKAGLPGNHGKLLPTTLAWNPAASAPTPASAAAATLAGGAATVDDLANITRLPERPGPAL